MQLSLQKFSSLVEMMTSTVQSGSRQLLDLTVGSILRAILEANASVALWMQWLILQVLQTTRAATSRGTDLDSWMGDFSLTRLPATPATGSVALSRFTNSGAAFVPVGALVKTGDGSQTFVVLGDSTNPLFSTFQNGYNVPVGTSSVNVPVQAQFPGVAGNVQPGSVMLLASAIPGMDSVSNSAAFLNGLDAESDQALRARFVNYIGSLSRATKVAVGYAITAIQQGLQYTIQENTDPSGAWRPGSFVVTIDDGSGAPSTSLLTTVAGAVEAVRPVGTTYAIQPPVLMTAAVSLSVAVVDPAQRPAIASAIQTAVTTYIGSLPIGASLPITRIAQLAYGASASVTNVTQILVNGTSSDLVPPSNGVIKPSLVTVS